MNTDTLQTANQWKEKGINYLIDHGGAILSGIVIFIIGIFVASWAAKVILRSLAKKKLQKLQFLETLAFQDIF